MSLNNIICKIGLIASSRMKCGMRVCVRVSLSLCADYTSKVAINDKHAFMVGRAHKIRVEMRAARRTHTHTKRKMEIRVKDRNIVISKSIVRLTFICAYAIRAPSIETRTLALINVDQLAKKKSINSGFSD